MPTGFFAQSGSGQPQFSAKVEAPQVAVGTNFEVVFDLKNGEGRQFRPPSFTGFKKLAGPSTQSSVTIINGQYSQSMGWTFILQAQQPGTFSIGEASVMVGGQLLRTQPIKVEVVPARGNIGGNPKVNAPPPGLNGNQDIFVAAEVGQTNIYVGQQTVVNFTLYTRIGVESYDVLVEPKMDGFFAKDLTRFDTRTRQVNIRGREYIARILRSVALFPQQSGTLTIGSMRFQFGTTPPGSSRDPFSALFGRGSVPVVAENLPVAVRVKPLPEPAPANFSGVVGQYEWKVEADKTELTTDDAVTLRLSIQGNGDGNRFVSPTLHLSPELEIYEPNTSGEETYENGEQLIHARTLEYAILPKQPGTFSISPEMVVFNPDSNRYVVKKLGNPLTIKVSQGKQNGTSSLRSESTATDISPLRTSTQRRTKGEFFVFTPLFWILVLLPFAGLGGFYFWEKQKERQAAALAASPELRAKIKSDMARERLTHARKLMDSGDARGFYDEVLKSVQGYLAAKLGVQPSDLTQHFLVEKLATRGASGEVVERLNHVLQACEMALFAGQVDSEGMTGVCQQAEDAVRRLEKEL